MFILINFFQVLTSYDDFIDLRPIEEFRHTPIIPISEKDLADNRRKIEERNRRGVYVEIKKDTIYFYGNLSFFNL